MRDEFMSVIFLAAFISFVSYAAGSGITQSELRRCEVKKLSNTECADQHAWIFYQPIKVTLK